MPEVDRRSPEAAKMKNLIAIALLLFALFGLPKVGNDSGPTPSVVPTITVPEPSKEMKSQVEKIAAIMRSANIIDRMAWGQIWAKAAKAVAADSTDDRIIWKDTNQLRNFTETALRIGWRRLGGNASGKYAGLSEAVEAAFGAVLSDRVQSVTPELRKKYVDLCNAIAWAGVGRDQ